MTNSDFDPVRFLEEWKRDDELFYEIYLELWVLNKCLGEHRSFSPIESIGPSINNLLKRIADSGFDQTPTLDERMKRKHAIDRAIGDLKLPLKIMSIDPSFMRIDDG